jgi:hypothetical protein
MKKLALLILALALGACSNDKRAREQAFLDSLETMSMEAPLISEEVMMDIIQQIPSPLEISFLLKDAGTRYDYAMLNAPENVSRYTSSFAKALNLGVYGTDLGYANIYEQNQDALRYMSAIRGLADDLSIGQFFDFNTISRLAANSRNLDSLLTLTTQNFNTINAYLQENQRPNLSVLLLTGGWLEALNITCEVAQKNPANQALIEKIGEQKIILDNIKLLLGFYTADPYISDLHGEIMKLDEVYAQIEIVYTYAEPTFREVNGMLVVQDNSTSTIRITPEDVAAIRQRTAEIRNKIIG